MSDKDAAVYRVRWFHLDGWSRENSAEEAWHFASDESEVRRALDLPQPVFKTHTFPDGTEHRFVDPYADVDPKHDGKLFTIKRIKVRDLPK